MYRHTTKCRACHSEDLQPVVDLGVQPLANDFRDLEEERAGYAPLRVLYCNVCSLAQLSVVVDPQILYQHYSYVTSHSATMLAHFQAIRADIPHFPARVIEIGSNDGTLLKMFEEDGSRVCGIDPAANLSKLVPTVEGLFDESSAETAMDTIGGHPDLIIARHVFCHVDNWWEFIDNLSRIAHRDTLVYIEVPYAEDMLEKLAFDQIYHEHLSYLTVRAMTAALDHSNLRLNAIRHYDIHGGCVGMFLRRMDSGHVEHSSVIDYRCNEVIPASRWKTFADEAWLQSRRLITAVKSARDNGKRVAAFGASAKATVWINYCGFDLGDLDFICDCTPEKIGKLVPGTGIRVVPEVTLTEQHPDYTVCFAHTYLPEILAKTRAYADEGGQWISAGPQVKVIEPCNLIQPKK